MAMAQDDSLVKRAYAKVTYTKEQVDELRKCMDPVTGPTYFIENYMYIQHAMLGRQKIQLYDFQYDLIDNYHKYRKSINMVSRQMGKALAVTTPILTPAGFKTIDDLSVGDPVYGPDGTPANISYITETMFEHQCYEIEFANGEKITADSDHLWSYTLASGTTLTTDTKELNSNFRVDKKLYIPSPAAVEFDYANVNIHPYVYGLLLAHSGDDNTVLCSIDDYTKYKTKLQSFGYSVSKFKMHGMSTDIGKFSIIDINNQCVGINKPTILPEYVFNSIDMRKHLLNGLCGSNIASCISHRSAELIVSIRDMLSTLGIYSNIKRRKRAGNVIHDLHFDASAKSAPIHIKSIKKTSSVPVRCLQVDNESHMFLCGKTLIPTHNTTVAAGYLLWYAMFINDATILIASNKYDGAQEIMYRVRYAYESIPDHIRAGAKTYNKRSLDFDNGSRIVATTTTGNTGRGMSLSLVYCLGGENTVTVRDKETGVIKAISLQELYNDLDES